MKVFFEKVAEIEQHNARFEAGEESFSMAINQFSDMVSRIYNFYDWNASDLHHLYIYIYKYQNYR